MLVNNCIRTQWDGISEGSAQSLLPGCWNSYRQFEKFIMPDMASAVLAQAANPVGFYLSRVYDPPIAVGEGSWRPQGDGDLTATGYAAILGSVDFTGSGDFAGAGQKLVVGIIALTGTGTFTGSVVGDLNASFNLTGTGTLEGDMAGIASALLDLVGTGDFEGGMNGVANASIDIVVTGTGLTTANVGQAVWNYLLASGYSASEAMDVLTAVAAGKVSGGSGSPVFRSIDDTRNVVSGVADSSGNRTTSTITAEG
jgi:hypothetical protein